MFSISEYPLDSLLFIPRNLRSLLKETSPADYGSALPTKDEGKQNSLRNAQ